MTNKELSISPAEALLRYNFERVEGRVLPEIDFAEWEEQPASAEACLAFLFSVGHLRKEFPQHIDRINEIKTKILLGG